MQAGIVRIWRARIRTALAGIDAAAHDLGLMAELLARLEIEPFESARLAAVRAALVVEGDAAVAPDRAPPAPGDVPRSGDAQSAGSGRSRALLLVREQTAVGIDRWHAAYGPAVATVAAGGRRCRSALGAGHVRLRTSGRSVSGARRQRSAVRRDRARSSAHRRAGWRAKRRAPRRRSSARAHRQRIEHVRQEHAAARRSASTSCWRWRARRCAPRT